MESARLIEHRNSKNGRQSANLKDSVSFGDRFMRGQTKGFFRRTFSLIVFSLQLLAVFFAVFLVGNHFAGKGRQKSDNLITYKNDMPFNTSYVFTLVLYDLSEKEAREMATISELHYNPNWDSESVSGNFDFSVLSRRLRKKSDRYRVEGLVTYMHPIHGKNETVNCFCDLTYKVQKVAAIMTNETIEGETAEETSQPSSITYLRSQLYFQFVFDEAVYDFTENPLLQYVYHREPTPIERTDFDSSSGAERVYKPRIDCSQFWSVEEDRIDIKDLPEDEEIDIDVNFGLTTIDHYMWGLKLRLAEEYIEQLPNGRRLIDDLKHFFFDNGIQIKYVFLVLLLGQMLFSIITTYKRTNTLSGASESSMSLKQSAIQAICRSVIVVYLINQDASSIAVIAAGFRTIYDFVLLLDKVTTKSMETSKTGEGALTFLLTLSAVIIGVAFGAHSYWTAGSTNAGFSVLASGAVIAYGLILTNWLAIAINLLKSKSIPKLSRGAILYEIFTSVCDDVFVWLVDVPIIHKISAFTNDLILLIFFLRKIIAGKSDSKVTEMSESELSWMIDMKKEAKKNGHSKAKAL